MSGCIFPSEPAEAFGARGVLAACGTSKVVFETKIACRLFSYANVIDMIPKDLSYNLLMPSDEALTAFLSKNGLTESDFIKSSLLVPFVRDHAVLESVKPGNSVNSLSGNSYQVSGTADNLLINSKPVFLKAKVGSEAVSTSFFQINVILP